MIKMDDMRFHVFSTEFQFSPEVIIFFLFNSAEYEISNAHQYKIIKKFSIFQAPISLKCYFPAHKC